MVLDNMKTAEVRNLESLCRKEGATVLELYPWHRLTAHIGSLKGISSPGIHDPHRCDSVYTRDHPEHPGVLILACPLICEDGGLEGPPCPCISTFPHLG